jgi:hypothetical protein
VMLWTTSDSRKPYATSSKGYFVRGAAFLTAFFLTLLLRLTGALGGGVAMPTLTASFPSVEPMA